MKLVIGSITFLLTVVDKFEGRGPEQVHALLLRDPGETIRLFSSDEGHVRHQNAHQVFETVSSPWFFI